MKARNKPLYTLCLKSITFIFLVFGSASIACGSISTSVFSPPGTRLANLEDRIGYGNVNMLAWSPNGKTIAVTANFLPPDSNPLMWADGKVPTPFSEILFADAEGGTITSFYKEETTEFFYATNWSPDNKKIILVRPEPTYGDYSRSGIWIFDTTDNVSSEYIGTGRAAGWSPDGNTIAILDNWRDKSGGQIYESIWTIRLFATHTKKITNLDSVYVSGSWRPGSLFTWSSDNKEILFDIAAQIFDGKSFVTSSKLYVYNLEKNTTSNEFQNTLKGINRNARISPSLGIVSYITHENKLMFITVDNNCTWEFPQKNIYIYTWSPDSKNIAYEYSGDVYIVNLKDIFGENIEETSDCP